MRKTVIVGIDPGITAAYAVLDTEGNVICIRSGKDLDKNKIIREVSQCGDPAIIASDVNPAPTTVHSISSAFSAKLFYPKIDMSVDEKKKLAKLGGTTKNLHERDALGAAFRAFKDHRDLIDRVKRRAPQDRQEKIMKLILSGKVNRIATAIHITTLKVETPAHRILREEKQKRKIRLKTKPKRYKPSAHAKIKPVEVNLLKPRQKEEPFNKERFIKWADRYKKKKER